MNFVYKNLKEVIAGILFFLFLSLPFNSKAQDVWDVRDITLKNGLRVLFLEDHRTDTVTFQVWYRVGSRNEHFGITGISHLLEHMMFRGTKRYGPGDFWGIVQRNGGDNNAFTTKDFTTYFENIASDKVDILIDLESDRMTNVLLDPELFLIERNVVTEERRLRTEDDPFSDLLEQVNAIAFKAHPYHFPVIGFMSDLEQITRDDVYECYKTYYVPNNAILVVVGDFKTEELLPKIKSSFGQIESGEPPPKVRSNEPPQRGERRLNLRRSAELPFVVAGYHTPNFSHPDSFALDVLSTALTNGNSSSLYRSLVYDKQLALYIGGDYSRLSIDPDLIYFYAQVMPGKSPSEVENAIYEEIDKIKKEPISQYELEKAKNQIESSFVFSQDSLFGKAFLLGQYEILGNWKMLKNYISGIRAVTAEDIMEVANKYLNKENRTVGVLIPEKPES